MAPAADALETPVYLESGDENVFALHTFSPGSDRAVGVVLAHSGANNFSSHRNGVFTSIARQLMREGIPSLRFDFVGTGESSGTFVPGIGQPVADVRAAMDALRAAGCERLLIVGSCFGAIPSVVAAVDRRDVAGVILLSPPLVLPDGGRAIRERIRETVNRATMRLIATNREYRRWFFARLLSLARTRGAVTLSRARRPTPSESVPERDLEFGRPSGLLMEAELARLVTSGMHVEIVYGTADGNLLLVQQDRRASAAISLLADGRPAGLVWTVLEGPVHGFEEVAVQEELIGLVVQRAAALRQTGAVRV